MSRTLAAVLFASASIFVATPAKHQVRTLSSDAGRISRRGLNTWLNHPPPDDFLIVDLDMEAGAFSL
ncbi:hypothetical protein [Agrobacterium sp. B1(2019)]|uniref:hypothetical protein n=1 Tax=Agrobacterium sp. B1(2019) TaxID=2607032 RepID=UPI0011EFDA00|nr:hypothetical protein [Agrobacterium sp. B1(2019)]TZG32267.1 hypothetical protein AGR1_25110 [Agrobacterium sp. B1(2019)]